MWKSISRSISSFGSKKNLTELDKKCQDSSDDETSSNLSNDDEGLECPICWESFNMVENVPYVLWCGHTLCKNCLTGLRRASLKISSQSIKVPLFVSCPWCNLLTFRLLHKGNLRFPSKNYFLLWMVEIRSGERAKSASSIHRDHRESWSPWCPSVVGNYYVSNANGGARSSNGVGSERSQVSLHKSLDFFIHVTAKFPLVLLLVIVLSALPVTAGVLLLYVAITVLFAVPAFLVLYFAYHALDWLVREIRS